MEKEEIRARILGFIIIGAYPLLAATICLLLWWQESPSGLVLLWGGIAFLLLGIVGLYFFFEKPK